MGSLCGVLALQGDWEAHATILQTLGAEVRFIRCRSDLDGVGGLVLPGGESTSMLRLMETEELNGPLQEMIRAGLPVLATCAGVILLAETVVPEQETLGLLEIDVERNAYGRQIHSMVADVELVPELGAPSRVEGVFIRAPRIIRHGNQVEILGRWENDPVLVRQGRLIAATYHPELTTDHRAHQLLLQTMENKND